MPENNLRLFTELKDGDVFHRYAETAPLVKVNVNTYKDERGVDHVIAPHRLVFLFANPATIRKE
jgi:hypothetical protein